MNRKYLRELINSIREKEGEIKRIEDSLIQPKRESDFWLVFYLSLISILLILFISGIVFLYANSEPKTIYVPVEKEKIVKQFVTTEIKQFIDIRNMTDCLRIDNNESRRFYCKK